MRCHERRLVLYEAPLLQFALHKKERQQGAKRQQA